MKACNLHAVGDLRYEELETPRPGPGQVLLKVRAAGICGSDVPRVFTKGTYHFPTVVGHEFAGEIVESPDDPSLVGKKAAVFPMLPCMECPACEIGEYPQCENYDYYGSRRDGGFAEYLAVNRWNLVLVPEGVPAEHAAMCEPAAVAIHALRQAGVGLGDTVAVFGAGTIGLLAAQVARGWGARQVVLVDIDPRNLEFATTLGFRHTVNSAEADPAGYIREITDGRGADLSLEAAGVSATLAGVLTATRMFGRVVLMGNPAGEMKLPQKAYWEILRKQLTLRGTWNSGYSRSQNDWQTAIDLMDAGVLQMGPLITHRFPLSQCGEAFAMMRDRSEFFIKVMFVMD